MMKIEGTRVGMWLVVLVFMGSMVEHGVGQGCIRPLIIAIVQLIPCRAAVAQFSLVSPSEACCDALNELGRPCLCELFNGPPIPGVDRNLAFQLPEKCAIDFKPCDGGR